jgi:hypothetical protein
VLAAAESVKETAASVPPSASHTAPARARRRNRAEPDEPEEESKTLALPATPVSMHGASSDG